MSRCRLLICGLALVSSANIAVAGWIDTFKTVVDFYDEVYERASETAEVFDFLWRTGPEIDEEIERRFKSAKNYHPKAHVFPPKIDADQAFSKFKEVRDGVRKQWADFVDDERSEIQRLQRRRQQHLTDVARYEQRLREMGRARDVCWALSKDPKLSAVGQYEYAKKAAELEGMLPQLAELVGEHRRILEEFDLLIARKQKEAKAHQDIQGVLEDARKLPTYLDTSGSQLEQDDTSAGDAAPRPKARSFVEQRIDSAVDAVGQPVLSNAERERREADARHKTMTKRNDGIAARERPSLTGGSGTAGGNIGGAGSPPNGGSGSSGSGTSKNPDNTFTTTITVPKKGTP